MPRLTRQQEYDWDAKFLFSTNKIKHKDNKYDDSVEKHQYLYEIGVKDKRDQTTRQRCKNFCKKFIARNIDNVMSDIRKCKWWNNEFYLRRTDVLEYLEEIWYDTNPDYCVPKGVGIIYPKDKLWEHLEISNLNEFRIELYGSLEEYHKQRKWSKHH